MGRPFNRVKGPGAATAVTPRHSPWSGVVERSRGAESWRLPRSSSLPLTTSLPEAARSCCLVAGPTVPLRAGDTLKPWNNEVTEYGGMP